MRQLGAVLGSAALAVVIAGCGAQISAPPAGVAPTTVTEVSAQTAVSAAHLLRPVAPLPAPVPSAFVVTSPSGGDSIVLAIVDASGHTVARTTIPSADQWLTAAGPGGAYWLDGGHVHALATDGTARTLDAVPSTANGLLVSPDGQAFAYALSTGPDSAGVIDNRIVVQRFGATPHTITDRRSDGVHASSDTPGYWWTYLLLSWTKQGILFVRGPYGGCGCAPFDMETQAGYTGLIDPVTSGTADLTSDPACPLSGLGPYQTAACFHGGPNVDELRLEQNGHAASTFSMSGTSAAGGAVFSPDASRLAYVTERQTSTDGGCDGTWLQTLHVLSLNGDGARAATIKDFATVRWTATGLYGALDSADSWRLVSVDVTTLAVHTIWSGPALSHVIGLT